MNLFILRHGLAVEPDTRHFAKDSDRPLTAKGKKKVSEVAQAMLALELSFDRILTSPYVRARETAEIVADAFQARKKLELLDCLTPGGSIEKLIKCLAESDGAVENVLLVGHEPFLSRLISFLLFGDAHASITMKKAGLCRLTIEKIEAGRCATLEWLVPAKILTGISS